MKNLKLIKIEGSNIINFLNEKHHDFNIMDVYSYGNDANINFNKIANDCDSLEEFKQALENLQIEEMVHSTYFSGYFDIFSYGEMVKNLDTEDVVYFVTVENLTYSIFLNDENGEELESFNDLHEIEYFTKKIQNSINKQLENVNDMIDWIDNYNNFIEEYEDASVFEIAKFLASSDFDYLHGLRIINADDLYLNEDQEEEMEELKAMIEKIKEYDALEKQLTKKKENAPAKKVFKI